MLDMHKQLPKAKTPHEQESFQRSTVTGPVVSDLSGLRVMSVGAVQPSESAT